MGGFRFSLFKDLSRGIFFFGELGGVKLIFRWVRQMMFPVFFFGGGDVPNTAPDPLVC